MNKLNKVTRLYQADGNLTDEAIQAHIDEQNADSWYLIFVEDKGGWYRFYWAKDPA